MGYNAPVPDDLLLPLHGGASPTGPVQGTAVDREGTFGYRFHGGAAVAAPGWTGVSLAPLERVTMR